MEKAIEMAIIDGRWTANGRIYIFLDDYEKKQFNAFFKTCKIKS